MTACISVKGKQFEHQLVYDGPGEAKHCIYCQQPASEIQSKPTFPASSNKGKTYKCVSHKRLIHKVCVEALESKDLGMREKIKAAAILERMSKERDLAARRREKNKRSGMSKKGTVTQMGRLDDLLCRTGTE